MLTMPWAPTINSYYMFGKRLSQKGRIYRDEACAAVWKAIGHIKEPLLHGCVRIDIELRAPDNRRRDIDNNLKALLDALTHARVWADDSQIIEMTIRKGAVIRPGQMIVNIAPLEYFS